MSRSGLVAAQAERLRSLARQWQPTPAQPPPVRSTTDSDWFDGLPGDVPAQTPRLAFAPWTGAAVRGLAVLLAAALSLAGWWWWTGRPIAVAVAPEVIATGSPFARGPSHVGSGDAAAPSPAVTMDPGGVLEAGSSVRAPEDLVVHVIGFVARPGLVRVASGSRVADAIEQAGGVTRRRAADSVNLARLVVDGEQIVVAARATAVQQGPAAGVLGPTDLNTASASDLEDLPGVGPVLAGRIIQWRSDNGPFRSVDELGEVTGIGDAILEQLRPLVRV